MADKYAHLRPARPRECYRDSGSPKLRLTEVEAGIKAAAAPWIHAYQCSLCDWWHTGHDSRRNPPPPDAA